MRALAVVLLVSAACGRRAAPPAPDAASALPLATFVEVSAEAECARLRADKPPGAIEPHLREALERRNLARAGYDEAARLHPEAVRLVDGRVAACRAAAGYQARPLDGGVVWEKLPP